MKWKMWHVQGSWWPCIQSPFMKERHVRSQTTAHVRVYIDTRTPCGFWCRVLRHQTETVCNNQYLPCNPFLVSLPSIDKRVTSACCQQHQILLRVFPFTHSFVWLRDTDSWFRNSEYSDFYRSSLNCTFQISVVSKISFHSTFSHHWKN